MDSDTKFNSHNVNPLTHFFSWYKGYAELFFQRLKFISFDKVDTNQLSFFKIKCSSFEYAGYEKN